MILRKEKKVEILRHYLLEIKNNYADSFKTDIYFFIDDFSMDNDKFQFLNTLNSETDIHNWVDKLTSRIVLKFDEESEQISDFIYDYIELG